MLTGELIEALDLRVRLSQPQHQTAQCIAEVADGLLTPELRLQMQFQVTVDNRLHPGWSSYRREPGGPGTSVDPTRRLSLDLPDGEQQ